jgi:isopenicillin-N N-acyltransferase-like protein
MFEAIHTPDETQARQRGLAHGQQGAHAIAHSMQTYARLFAQAGWAWPQVCARALEFVPVVAEVDVALVDEVKGIAEGCGQTEAAIWALNCRSEILPPNFMGDLGEASQSALRENEALGLRDWATSGLDPALADGECTALSVSGRATADGHTYFAQNWDWMGRQRESLRFLVTRNANGQSLVTLTEAGMLGKIGLNAQGLALGLNIIRSVDDGSRLGVPVHVLLRHLLGLDSVQAMRQRLSELDALGFGASSNVPCADGSGDVASFEISPHGWGECQAGAHGTVAHSNHFLCPTLAPHQAPMAANLSSDLRLATAQRHGQRQGLDRPALEAFLRDQSDGDVAVCRSPDPSIPVEARVESVAGVIADVSAKRWWVAPDVPHRCAFEPAPTAW